MAKNHNDRPALTCQLERDAWRDSIIQHIRDSRPPKVIAIHGTWGTGKTSLLAQMYRAFGGEQYFQEEEKSTSQNQREKNNDLHPVWFEAWQYQHEANILAALLKEIRDQLSFPATIKQKLTQKGWVALKTTLQSIDLTFKIFNTEFGFKELTKNYAQNKREMDKKRFAEPLSSVMMKKMLHEAIAQLLSLSSSKKRKKQNDDKKAVIFIDDLDRCEPETAFRILESIKVYLDLDNCVFVLGMDIHAMDHMLAKHYEKQFKDNKDFNQLKNMSRLYLEKICQDVFHLPILSYDTRAAYFKALLTQCCDDKKPASAIIAKLATTAHEYKILPPFPRSIKMFANVILSHLEKKERTEKIKTDETLQKAFLIITYLYTFHYEIYFLCFSYPDFYNSVFLEYCKNPLGFKRDQGEHPVLSSLILPPNEKDAKEAARGQKAQEAKNALLTNTYPHAKLRQVLWIRQLVMDTGSLEELTLTDLKL